MNRQEYLEKQAQNLEAMAAAVRSGAFTMDGTDFYRQYETVEEGRDGAFDRMLATGYEVWTFRGWREDARQKYMRALLEHVPPQEAADPRLLDPYDWGPDGMPEGTPFNLADHLSPHEREGT